MEIAACRGVADRGPGEPERRNYFFPERGQGTRVARSFCESCTVRADCKAYADKMNIHHGVWGGEMRKRGKSQEPTTT